MENDDQIHPSDDLVSLLLDAGVCERAIATASIDDALLVRNAAAAVIVLTGGKGSFIRGTTFGVRPRESS